MIKVYFPPGCYGTYFSRCLYNYTNLRKEPFVEFGVDQYGSSHQHRQDRVAHTVIKEGHLETLLPEPGDRIVTILPCSDHELDYYNNQFFKHQRGQLISYILSQITEQEAEFKLKNQWGYIGKFDDTVPHWIMREWCSFWIANTLQESYKVTKYMSLDSIVQFSTQDIFKNFSDTLSRVTTALGLTITVDSAIINKQHNDFLTAQKFHNTQKRCDEYVSQLIDNKNSTMDIHSIFEEAYIQHLLREQRLEIRCDGLDIFPQTIQHLKTLTYETSNNCNQG